jgi:2-polyprenyl-3-methyl-5-hydroxy-6-metoxy-1,4-benzoquinol methylase
MTDTARHEAIAETIARHAKPRSHAIEFGCGDGQLAAVLARTAPIATVVGYDIDHGHVNAANDRAAVQDRVTFGSLDADSDLGLIGDAEADLVVAIDILEHLRDPFAFVAHLARITRLGGILALRVPNVAYLKRRAELLTGRLPITASWFGPTNNLAAWRARWGWDGGHLHYFTADTLEQLLTESGWHVRSISDPGSTLSPLRCLAPGLLCGNLLVIAERFNAS